jgi:hypothetical protein
MGKQGRALLGNPRQELTAAAMLTPQPLVLLSQPSAQLLIEVAEQLGPQLRWIEPAVVLDPAPQDRIQSSGQLLQRQIGLSKQINLSDPVPQPFSACGLSGGSKLVKISPCRFLAIRGRKQLPRNVN